MYFGNTPELPGVHRPCRIVLADDHPMVLTGLRKNLAVAGDAFRVVGQASNGEDAIAEVLSLTPDLAILDLKMPVLDGIQATREIKICLPRMPILIFTAHEKPAYLFEAVLAGVAGYILKESSSDRIIDTVHRVLAGEPVLEASIVREYMHQIADPNFKQHLPYALPAYLPSGATDRDDLSDREKEVLIGIAAGLTNEQIARQLYLSPHTVKKYVSDVIVKLGASDRTQAAVFGTSQGLIPQSELAAPT